MVRLPHVTRAPSILSAWTGAFFLALLLQASGVQAQQPAAQAGSSYTVRSGDTLDRIIAQSHASSPLSLAFLRDAFARLNPSAFPKGPQGPLMAGAVLRIPDAADLRRLAFPDLDPSAARSPADGATAAAPSAPAPLTAAQREEIERRSWVRYP